MSATFLIVLWALAFVFFVICEIATGTALVSIWFAFGALAAMFCAIGEMSFLLNDRRSATILASGNCKLIKIPKIDFLDMIRKNPHYGIFLSKMLAQRLFNQTHQTIELKKLLMEEKQNVTKL